MSHEPKAGDDARTDADAALSNNPHDVATDGGRRDRRPSEAGKRLDTNFDRIADALQTIADEQRLQTGALVDLIATLERIDEPERYKARSRRAVAGSVGDASLDLLEQVDLDAIDRLADSDLRSDGGRTLPRQVSTVGPDAPHVPAGVSEHECSECGVPIYLDASIDFHEDRELLCPVCREGGDLVTDGGVEIEPEPVGFETPTAEVPLWGLTGFARDLLWTVRGVGPASGQELKDHLERHDDVEVNHGRLYPNLDTLVDHGFVERGSYDRRTNKYEVTDAGREALESRAEWADAHREASR